MPRELWAKIAVEITRDPKLLPREPWERWLWLGLICLTKENANGDGMLHGYNPRLLASLLDLRVTAAKVKAALEAFVAVGMVRLHADDAIELVHFKKRQEAGLNGTREQAKERKERWKERHGNVNGTPQSTAPERPGNVIEEEEEEDLRSAAAADLGSPVAARAAAAEIPPGFKSLPAFLAATWPGFPDPAGTVVAWVAAFPKLDLLAQVKAARAKELATGEAIKQPGSYLLRWFETSVANPVTRKVNGSRALQEGTAEWDQAKREGDERAKRERERTKALLAERDRVHREGHE